MEVLQVEERKERNKKQTISRFSSERYDSLLSIERTGEKSISTACIGGRKREKGGRKKKQKTHNEMVPTISSLAV